MRKSKGALPAVLLLFVVLLLTAAILYKFVFVIRNVEVVGKSDRSAEEVYRLADIDYGHSIFFIDETALKKSIEDTGTLIYRGYTVRKPNTIILQLDLRTPIVSVPYGGYMLVLDENAYVIRRDDISSENDLIYINRMNIKSCRVGEQVGISTGEMNAYCAVMNALVNNNAVDLIAEADIENASMLTLKTGLGVVVQLGTYQDMEAKISKMKQAILDMQSRGERTGTLDVSGSGDAYFSPGA